MSLNKKLLRALFALSTVLLTFTFSHAQVADTIRVNCGGPDYTDPSGRRWSADYGSSGGSSYSASDPITGTNMPDLFQTELWGDTQSAPFFYSFALPQKSYTVKLLFAEIYNPWCQTGSRAFNVDINGTPVLQNFDIFATAGACDAALVQQFTATPLNGNIQINFTNAGDLHPKISAIEITPATNTSISKKLNGEQSKISISNSNGGHSVQTQIEGPYTLELRNLQGKRIGQKHGFGFGLQSFTNLNPGLYLLTSRTSHQTVTRTISVVR